MLSPSLSWTPLVTSGRRGARDSGRDSKTKEHGRHGCRYRMRRRHVLGVAVIEGEPWGWEWRYVEEDVGGAGEVQYGLGQHWTPSANSVRSWAVLLAAIGRKTQIRPGDQPAWTERKAAAASPSNLWEAQDGTVRPSPRYLEPPRLGSRDVSIIDSRRGGSTRGNSPDGIPKSSQNLRPERRG